MAEELQDLQLSKAPYPAPPPFWQYFTIPNITRLQDIEYLSRVDADNHEPNPLPYELTVLRPPPHPSSSTACYTLFNQTQDLPPKPTLPIEDERLLDYSQLASATGSARPHARYLRQILKSINLNFLELYSIMGDNPADWEDKLRDIGILLENFNSVINVLRPHQAREQLKTILECRLDEGKEEIEQMARKRLEIETFLKDVGSEAVNSQEDEWIGVTKSATVKFSPAKVTVHASFNEAGTTHKEKEKAARTWELLRDLDDD